MNLLCKTILQTVVFTIVSFYAIAQDKDAVPELTRQGVQLNDQGKYAEAVAKYEEALKIDPENRQANYEIAFSLFASGKGGDAIPYIEKTIKATVNNSSLNAASYDLLGSIYDQDKKSDLAIAAYKKGIEINPKYQRLRFNLGIAYFRNKQFAEAEQSAIEAIRLDPKHASSQRLYALVTFHQNKRVNALMGFCSLILLEPSTPRSAEAYNNIQHILQGGVLKDASGRNTIILSAKNNQTNEALNLAISMITLSGQTKKLTGMDLLEYELKSIFTIAGETEEKDGDDHFYKKFLADYFYKLAKSDNMPAFTRLLSLSANKDANTRWMTDNEQMVKQLDSWLAATDRSF